MISKGKDVDLSVHIYEAMKRFGDTGNQGIITLIERSNNFSKGEFIYALAKIDPYFSKGRR